MARVIALIPDLMFGSRVQASLAAAGHEVRLVGDVERARDLLLDGNVPSVLLVDLTHEAQARAR
ncbi:MAG TPA: hypothetical protein VMG62_08355, partial [Solirubrobacteraceae bacterium]|nr:hypothetical protein [Solirubrobacteraceae bacterium]